MKNTDNEKSQELFNAAAEENLPLVKELLLNPEININWLDENTERTPVGIAALNNNKKTVKILLEHGASIPYLESCSADIQEMLDIANLAYKIYGLDFLTEKEIKKLKSFENNLDSQELFINVFKHHLTSNDNLPGNNENLAKYLESIQKQYLDILPQEISKLITNTEQLAKQEVKALAAELVKYTDQKLSDVDNTELKSILTKLLYNQSLDYNTKTPIQKFLIHDITKILPIIGDAFEH